MGLLSDSDIGKKVFDDEDNLLGEIVDVDDDGASVKAAPDADADDLDPLDWSTEGENRLPHEDVDRVRADGIHTTPQ